MLLPDELTTRLTAILKPYVQDETAFAHLTENTHLLNDLKINSAHLVDVVLDVEEAFDIELNNQDMERMQTVGSALAIITEKRAAP